VFSLCSHNEVTHDRDTLLTYPYVVVRLACRYCARAGAYRLVRLAVKFGCEAKTAEVMIKLAADCPHWKVNRRWPEGCGVYLPDLEGLRARPDDPGTWVIRVIDGGKKDGHNKDGRTGEPDDAC
jgi:hypothetical protein